MADDLNNLEFHVVESTDTLESIARLYSLTTKQLISRNQLKPGSLIYPGQKLRLTAGSPELGQTCSISILPAAPRLKSFTSEACLVHGFHRIKPDETVSRIAAVFGVSTQSLLEANRLEWNSPIFVGQKLVIPGVHETQNCPDVRPLPPQYRALALKVVKLGLAAKSQDQNMMAALSQLNHLAPSSEQASDETIARLLQSRVDENWQVSAWVWLQQLKVELANA